MSRTLRKHSNTFGRRYKHQEKTESGLRKQDDCFREENPALGAVESDLARIEKRNRVRDNVFPILLGAFSVIALVCISFCLFFPALKIYDNSMTPSLCQGDIVLSLKTTDFKQGDIISFYYNDNILVKRVIATSGDLVDIDDDGNVSVNGKYLDESYVGALAKGNCDIELPYQVPDGNVFVMGDYRATSKDSRSKDIGAVTKDKMVGKIVFRIWPLNKIGVVK